MKEFIAAGEHRVGKGDGTLSVLGLGSCVVVVLYDETTRVGGLAHVLLPDPAFSKTPERQMKFAKTAVPKLVEELEAAGARRERIKARLVGGASMFRELLPRNQPNVGERVLSAARAALAECGIPVIGEEVGGDYGRSVHFDLKDGRVRVTALGREDVEI